MNYLFLPLHLLKFWYIESPKVLYRTWKNTLLYLEEDLAVGLMFRLLFVPLFHDSTALGRFLSFFFRSFRISLGLFAFLGLSLFILALSLIWLAIPGLIFVLPGYFSIVSKLILFSGVVLFVNHLIIHSPKVKKQDQNFAKLLTTYQVKKLLLYLEQTPENFSGLPDDKAENVCYLAPEHLFVAKLKLVPGIEEKLLKMGLKLEDFSEALKFLQKRADTWKVIPPWDENFKVHHLRGINRGWLGVITPSLDKFSDDLTRVAAKQLIPDFIGRPEIIKRVIDILSQNNGQNVALIGEPGSGRGSLVGYLAKIINSGDAPRALSTKRLVRLDVSRLLAGINNQGELAERIKEIFEEVKFSGNIIVYVDEIQDLGLGEAGEKFNLYSLMLPYLEAAEFQFIAVADEAGYVKTVEKNKSFARLFTKIVLPPATEAETIEILQNRSIAAERSRKICTSVLAVESIAHLSARYIYDLVSPDGALKVFEECLIAAEGGWVKKSTVEKVIQERSSIPLVNGNSEVTQQLLNLEELIHQRMIDQGEAVSVVAKTLRRAAVELRDIKRPIGSFLFVGPTGVGKTELAKALVDTYFKSKGHFARFDMSEYQTTGSIIDKLTEEVRQYPYSLILLDEFEKADEKVLTLFLQILDDGRLTGGTGKTVDFTNTIIIATSNAASLTIAKGLQNGQTIEQLKKVVNGELLNIFKPELVNRFDEVVIFKPLSPDDLKKIVKLKLDQLQKQLKNQGFEVDFGQKLVVDLAQKGYDPILGARPLNRLIQDTLEAKLSEMILKDQIPKGKKFFISEL